MKPLVEGQPRTIGRREFVQKLAFTTTTAALSPLVTACLPDSQQSIVRKEKREVRTQPTLSDVIIVNKSAYLLGGDGKRYPLRTEEIDPYIVASKLNEHDRGVFTVPASFLEKYPLGQRREENILVNRSTMLPVENRMGEAVVLFMGMLTNSNDYSGDIGPQSFPQITQSLLSSGWRDSQNLLFTYGNKPSGKSIEQIVRD